MSFNALEFLVLSENLYDDGNYTCEATQRTIVSRAYYAMILFVNEKLKQYFNRDFSGAGIYMHREMIEYLRNSGPPLSMIGELLFTFRDNRNDADYHCNKKIKDENSISAIDDAKTIKSILLDNYPDL